MPPRGRARIRQAPQDRWRQPLEQHPGDAVPEPHATPLGGIVEKGRTKQVRIVVAAAQQLLGHVEPVSAIRDWHQLEERDAARGKDTADERLLLGLDPRADVGDELPDPMHR